MGFFIIVFGSIFSAAISTNSAIDAVYETTTQPTDTQSSTLSGDTVESRFKKAQFKKES